MTNNAANQSAARLSAELCAVDFALTETVLYLDAYPACQQALAYYQTLRDRRARLAAQYEKEVGPLTALGNESRTAWNWIRTPWPWEKAANGL